MTEKKQRKLKDFLILSLSMFIICFLLSGKVFAQTTFVTLEGAVTDEEGNALPGAAITVKNIETGYTVIG